MPTTLRDDQIRSYRENGYLGPVRTVSEAEALACRQRLEEFEAETGAPATQTLHMKSHLYFTWTWRLTRSPAVVGALQDLVGPDLLVLASRLWIKEPNDRKFVSWHQDLAYFGLDPQELTTVWIALTEATRMNGAMRFIPGSHLAAARRHEEAEDADNLLSRGQYVPGVDETAAMDAALRAGEFTVHHGHTLHSSAPNGSSDRRIGFGLMVMPTHVRSTIGRRSATLLHGEDRYGHWDLDPMPAGDRDPVIWRLMEEANARYRDRAVKQAAETDV